MSKEEYLNIAKGIASEALLSDDLYLRKYQNTFRNYKLDNISRPVVNFIMKIRDEIHNSQLSEAELDARKEQEKEDVEYAQYKEERQKELRKKAKKLRTIERERKRNRNNPYPYCNYDYGFVGTDYDLLTGKKTLHFVPNLTPDYQSPKH
jgi:hypothetical protein